MKSGLVILSTSATIRTPHLEAKPRVPPKGKDVKPGPVKESSVAKGEGRMTGYQASQVLRRVFQGGAGVNYSLVALVGK